MCILLVEVDLFEVDPVDVNDASGIPSSDMRVPLPMRVPTCLVQTLIQEFLVVILLLPCFLTPWVVHV